MKHILFVCTGNTCRSPLAEVFFNSLAQQRGLEIRASSAGVNVRQQGEPASENAMHVAAEHCLDLSRHRARAFTREVGEAADLILTMEARHRSRVERMLAGAKPNVFTVAECAGTPDDVADPTGGTLPDYRACAGQIFALVEAVVDRLESDHEPG